MSRASTGRHDECARVIATPGSACTSSRNASPRTSKLRNWSNEAQAGDSSTTGSLRRRRPRRRAPRARPRDRACRRRRAARWPSSVAAKSGRRLADQIGLADAREEAGERRDAAGLRLAAGDPVDVAEAGQRLRGGIGIGGLGIVDEQHAALAADLLHAMREAGKRCAGPAGSPSARQPERRARRRPRRRRSAHCARRAASRCRRDRAIALRGAARRLHDLLGLDVEPVRRAAGAPRRAPPRLPARSSRSAAAAHQSSSTPTIAVPSSCTPATSRSFTAA